VGQGVVREQEGGVGQLQGASRLIRHSAPERTALGPAGQAGGPAQAKGSGKW
jgi:hypothetical protein